MKSIAVTICIIAFSISLCAQTEQLIIKNNGKGNYVDHKVRAKENFYSIGRLFNVHPKHLALFNALDMAKGLGLGQTIKIPLSDTNYSHKSEFGTPVYYITASNETVYNVSTNNGVLMEKLRQWNEIPSDKLPEGSKLIVGYLFNSEQQANAVSKQPKEILLDKRKPDSSVSARVKNESVVDPKKEDVREIEPGPAKKQVVKEDGPDIQPKEDVTQIPQAPAKKEVVKEDVQKDEQFLPAKQESRPENPNQGYFRTSFDRQVKQQPVTKEQTLTSGIFKTASGWTDSKYYVLMEGAEPGTIVKVTNPSNNKVIYAKLLGEVSGSKAGSVVNVRISNAAAAALDITQTDKFIVKLNY